MTAARHLPRGLRLGVTALLAAACLAGVARPAAAEEPLPPIPGVAYPTGASALGAFRAGTIKLTMTTARSFKLRCPYTSNHLIVFTDQGPASGVVLPNSCQILAVQIYGSSGDDAVEVDMRRISTDASRTIDVLLGAGNDRALVRTWDNVRAEVNGGEGNDDLQVVHVPGTTVGQVLPTSAVMGGPGDDVVRHDGFAGLTSFGFRVDLDGGTGADRILGPTDATPTQYNVDVDDTRVRWSPVVINALINADTTTGSTGGLDVIDVQLRSTETWVTYNGRRIWLPARVQLIMPASSGSDQLTIRGGSSQTGVRVWGTGSTLTFRPFQPYDWNRSTKTLTQPGAKPWTYDERHNWVSIVAKPYS